MIARTSPLNKLAASNNPCISASVMIHWTGNISEVDHGEAARAFYVDAGLREQSAKGDDLKRLKMLMDPEA